MNRICGISTLWSNQGRQGLQRLQLAEMQEFNFHIPERLARLVEIAKSKEKNKKNPESLFANSSF